MAERIAPKLTDRQEDLIDAIERYGPQNLLPGFVYDEAEPLVRRGMIELKAALTPAGRALAEKLRKDGET